MNNEGKLMNNEKWIMKDVGMFFHINYCRLR